MLKPTTATTTTITTCSNNRKISIIQNWQNIPLTSLNSRDIDGYGGEYVNVKR